MHIYVHVYLHACTCTRRFHTSIISRRNVHAIARVPVNMYTCIHTSNSLSGQSMSAGDVCTLYRIYYMWYMYTYMPYICTGTCNMYSMFNMYTLHVHVPQVDLLHGGFHHCQVDEHYTLLCALIAHSVNDVHHSQ